MKGSEKQIAWATSLIDNMDLKFQDMLNECKKLFPDNVGECETFLNSVKAAFAEAPAWEVIDLLKDRKEIGWKAFYNALYHKMFASNSPVAEKFKVAIENVNNGGNKNAGN